jgi:calcineurin-like phosphoesterase family protein
MIDFLSISRSANRKVFFWSDIHNKHARDFILKPRNFANPEEAEQETIKRWNAKCTNDDIGFLLGDNVVGAGEKGREAFFNLLHKLNYSELFVMPGNHPSGFASLFREMISNNQCPDKHLRFKFQLNENKTVYLIPNYFEIVVEGQIIIMSHYPILSWNKMKESFMLYGHVHNNLRKTAWIRDNFMLGKNHDLSIESSPHPLEFAEIQKIMQNKKILKVDHHGEETI